LPKERGGNRKLGVGVGVFSLFFRCIEKNEGKKRRRRKERKEKEEACVVMGKKVPNTDTHKSFFSFSLSSSSSSRSLFNHPYQPFGYLEDDQFVGRRSNQPFDQQGPFGRWWKDDQCADGYHHRRGVPQGSWPHLALEARRFA
jgi:hypothetical protein